MNYELKLKRNNIPEKELLEDLQIVAKKCGQGSISMDAYEKVGHFGRGVFKKRFGSWNKALKAAGLLTSHRNNIPSEELFANMALVWEKLGKQPSQNDLNDQVSKFHSGTYKKRFGTYNGALKFFIEWANGRGKNSAEIVQGVEQPEKKPQHGTKRDTNLRLRFIVMKRDNFKCKNCGRSPATDPAVVLHVDHIESWDKGGETMLENLQTLCSKCNLGKSNL